MSCSFHNLLQKIFGLFKTMNLKNTYIQIYGTFSLPRLPLNKLFVDLLHRQIKLMSNI